MTDPHDPGPFRLGVLVSGEGTTLANLIERVRDGRLAPCEIAVVVSSQPAVRAVDRARAAGIAVQIIRVHDSPDVDAFSVRVVDALERHGVDLGVQAGWLCYWRLPPRWIGRVINVHPALLPDFGGRGFFGRHVHEAVLAAGRRESGATVHFVDNEYDHGPIIAQARCAVEPGDTPETLAARVQALERELLPDVIRQLAAQHARR
ncbi:MAG: phosphoribosylglycinamide formyltransferase [Phycisphaerae bacterium]|nr:phosphoribosylglycinamide formyltransferase [Phycisphaerae bacterium]